MGDWVKKTLKLPEDHGWKCKPGYTIFVADRGAVRFDFPEDWIIRPGTNGSIKLMDREPPDDDCTLEMTIFYLNDQIDWSGLPMARILKEITEKDDDPDVYFRGDVQEIKRPRLVGAWREIRFVDGEVKREARSRTLVARWSNIQPLITFAFWESDVPRLVPVWGELLRSLVIGDYIEDPTRRVIPDPEPEPDDEPSAP